MPNDNECEFIPKPVFSEKLIEVLASDVKGLYESSSDL
jgi:hypothetical protein